MIFTTATCTFPLLCIHLQVSVVGVIRDAQESATNIMYTINDMTGEDIIVRKWLENEVWFLLHHVILWLAWSIHQAVNQLIFSQLTYKVINQFTLSLWMLCLFMLLKFYISQFISDYSSEWNFDFVVFLISLWNCFW